MQDTSGIVNYDTINALPHTMETKVNIAGVDYGEDVLIEVSTSLSLFTNDIPRVGSCSSGEIDIRMLTPNNSEIPRMAKIRPYIRLRDYNGNVSGWLQKGEYFIDTRKETKNDDNVSVMIIHGYDAMLKAEAMYPGDSASNYPALDTYVVGRIADQIGVTVDPRTTEIMTAEYLIPLPASQTMRETLGYIASMYAGNFVISEDGALRLIGLTEIGISTHYLVEDSGFAILFGDVRILV